MHMTNVSKVFTTIPSVTMRTATKRALMGLAALSVSSFAYSAKAEPMVIKSPGQHPQYSFEAEPHLLLGLWGVPGPGGGTGLGVGFRGSIPIVDNGFVDTINNSVAISFGLDWVHYDVDNWCARYWRGPVYCGYGDNFSIFWLPVMMQWNFYLTQHWSVFGEPGLALQVNDDHYNDNFDIDLALYVGGRYHFSDAAGLTLRLGWPGALTFGVSFFM
jgi:hypothetical protein